MSATEKALQEVLDVLDGWIEGAKSNHEALDHRDTDCCTAFHPEDIRNMVADARRSIEAKKRRKKRRTNGRSAVIVEVQDGITGSRRSHIITTGDTLMLNMKGFLISFDGTKPVSKIDVPVTIKARIA